MTPSRSLAAILSMAALLAACHRAPAPAPAVPPAAKITLSAEERREQDLMRAVFGAKYRPADYAALAALTDPENRTARSVYYITAYGNKVLDSGDAVLVANARPSLQDDEDPAPKKLEEPESSHADSALLNVFILRPKTGGGWTVIKRHENVAALGSNGQLGELSWPMLAKNKPGLAIRTSWTGLGYMIDFLALYDLSEPHLRDLAPKESKVRSDNEGACEEASSLCWSVDGSWRFVTGAAGSKYDDMVIDFSGEKSVLETDAPERTTKKIAQSARYVFDGERYRLTEGSNPVPDI